MVMDDTAFTSDATAAGMKNNRRMLLEQLATIRSLMMHSNGDEKDDGSHDIVREAMMCRKEQMANLSTEFLLTVLLDILLLRLLNDEKGEGEGEGETTTVPPMIPPSNQQQQFMDDAAAKKKKKAAAKRKRRKRNKAAAKHKKTKLMSWVGGGFISLIMMVAFSSITASIFTLSLVHTSDGSSEGGAPPALPPSASTSLRQRDHHAASTSLPDIISPLPAVVPPPIFSPATAVVSSHRMKSDEFRTTTCIDTPNWVDIEGDGCDWYEENEGCPNANYWEGYMGPATENCCHCVGGGHNQSPPITTPSSSPTISVNPTQTCFDTPNWKDKDGNGCDFYDIRNRCSLADDHQGYMGSATENCCSCVLQTSSPTNSPTITNSPTKTDTPSGPCFDTPNWKDEGDDGCDFYEENEEVGCPNSNRWEGEMGSATENCCYCGGGSHTLPPTNSPTISNSPTKPATPSGSHPASPSSLPTKSATPSSTPSSSPTICTDTEGWRDINGYFCDWYQAMDAPGCPRYGNQPNNYGVNFVPKGTANDHCCYCKNAVVNTNVSSLNVMYVYL